MKEKTKDETFSTEDLENFEKIRKISRQSEFITNFIAITGILVFVVSMNLLKIYFSINTTDSLPEHLFYKESRVRDITLQHNDYVRLCPLYSKVADFYRIFDYKKDTGNCDNGQLAFLKKIAAVPGDNVIVDKNGISVNGKLIKNTKALSSKARHFEFKGKVPKDSYLVYTDHKEGYDSRYFGFILKDEITHKIRPVF